MIAALKRRIRDLERQVERLQPRRTHDTMLQRTTRGTYRRPVRSVQAASAADSDPRWA